MTLLRGQFSDSSFAFMSYAPAHKRKIGFSIETVSAYYDFNLVADVKMASKGDDSGNADESMNQGGKTSGNKDKEFLR